MQNNAQSKKKGWLEIYFLQQKLTIGLPAKTDKHWRIPTQHGVKVKGGDEGDSFEGTGCIVLPRA